MVGGRRGEGRVRSSCFGFYQGDFFRNLSISVQLFINLSLAKTGLEISGDVKCHASEVFSLKRVVISNSLTVN